MLIAPQSRVYPKAADQVQQVRVKKEKHTSLVIGLGPGNFI
jgi:hypothetical protein